MALHIPDIIADYGPAHGYWCFSYERMNGILANTPNNNHNIEPQILTKILTQFCIDEIQLPTFNFGAEMCVPNALRDIVCDRNRDESCSSIDKVELMLSLLPEKRFEFQRKIDQGNVTMWPIKLLRPSKCNVKVDDIFYQQILDFCKATYDVEVYVLPKIDKYGRCFVNGQTFSSDYSCTERGSLVKALFVLEENSALHPYFGIVRFFFQVHLKLKDNYNNTVIQDHVLAYVTWMTFHSPEKDKISGLFVVNNSYYERDRIVSPRRFIKRCTLVPVGKKSSSYNIAELPR